MAKEKKQQDKVQKAQVEVVETNKTERYDEFFILVQRNDEVRIAVTNKIVTAKTFKTMEDAKKYIDRKPWELIVNTTIVINDINNELKMTETKKS